MILKKDTPTIEKYMDIPSKYGDMMLQSMCFLKRDGYVVCGYKKIDAKSERYCSIVKYSINQKKEMRRYDNVEAYHINDITYVPKKHCLAVITMTDPRGHNYIRFLDYENMSKKEEVVINYNSYLVGISYDESKDKYVLVGAGDKPTDLRVIIANDNFAAESFFDIPKNNRIFQSVELYNDMIFIHYNFYVEVYSIDGTLLKNYKLYGTKEGEGICSLGNGDFFIGWLDNTNYKTSSSTSRIYKFNIYEEEEKSMAYKVGLDYGHGGTDPGAIGNGLKESEIVIDIGRRVKNILNTRGIEVYESRTSETYVSLQDRVNYFNNKKVNCMVSIHCNSFNKTANGVETFCYKLKYRKLADYIQNSLLKFAPYSANRGVKENDLYMVKNTSMDACLTELAFIDNPNDAKFLINNKGEFALAIANGICDYLGVKYEIIEKPKPEPEKENDVMDKIVLYFGDLDAVSAIIVSQKYRCPMMKKVDFESMGLKAKEIIQIGGKQEDTNRFESFKNAAKLL